MRTVDFYYDFSSTNSYFAAFMLPEIAQRTGASINWLPIHLAALFRGTGFDVMAMSPRKARYLWRDHARYADLTGLPFRRPSRFPIKTSSALRAVLAVARHAGNSDAAASVKARLSQELFRAYWERDENIAEREVIEAAARRAGLEMSTMSATADSDEVRSELRAITERAAERGVFGAPMFSVGDEMFWGQGSIGFCGKMARTGRLRQKRQKISAILQLRPS
jgi:2-hydroxychromene-2-carboxylate isomerase